MTYRTGNQINGQTNNLKQYDAAMAVNVGYGAGDTILSTVLDQYELPLRKALGIYQDKLATEALRDPKGSVGGEIGAPAADLGKRVSVNPDGSARL